jgi:NADH-quinone oxidoreductase subunit C
MSAQEILDDLKAKFGAAIVDAKMEVPQPWIEVASDKTKEICQYLRDDERLKFDYLSNLSGVDYNNGKLGVVYHLASMPLKHKIVLKAICTKENPHVQSVADVWRTADWHEREAFDLIGILFDGHPDLRRILLPYDWEGYPLRKDYKVPEFYDGMKVPY